MLESDTFPHNHKGRSVYMHMYTRRGKIGYTSLFLFLFSEGGGESDG